MVSPGIPKGNKKLTRMKREETRRNVENMQENVRKYIHRKKRG